MYTNPQNGQAAARTAAPTAHRRNLMDLLAASPVITDAEYETAVTTILACQSVETLQKWYRNCIREIANREEAVGLVNGQLPDYATDTQKQEVVKLCNHLYILRKEKTAALLKLPRLDSAGATALIGELWAKILHRRERAAEGQDNASNSFSDAA